jgi:prepilin-type N-terminal cleavage/methylation domain-containing protein
MKPISTWERRRLAGKLRGTGQINSPAGRPTPLKLPPSPRLWRTGRRTGRRSQGFTLIELLVVIAIIGILASMTMVVIAKVHGEARKTEAKREIHALYNAIVQYHSDTGAYPVSNEVLAFAIAAHSDFTYGGASLDAAFGAPGMYSTNNSEVMAILMDRQKYSTGVPTVNFDHARNKRQRVYLNAVPQVDAADLPGLGPDRCFVIRGEILTSSRSI